MKAKAKSKAKTKTKTKRRTVSGQTKVIRLAIGTNADGDKIIAKTGDVEPNGDIRIPVDQGQNKIRFEYNYGNSNPNKTFALFIIRFVPDPGQGGGQNDSPFDAKIYISDDGWFQKNVRQGAKKGRYQYGLVLLDANGDLVTQDPQIIVE